MTDQSTSDGSESTTLDEVMDFPVEQADGERRWIVLFEEDFENVALDPEGNVGVLVDIEQAGEVLRLASEVLADLSHKDADETDPIEDMIAELEEVLNDAE